MVIRLLFQIIFLMWITDASAQLQPSPLRKFNCKSNSLRFPFEVDACCAIESRFETDYISDTSVFTKSFKLEVQEFSLSHERRCYVVRYCQTKILPDFKNFNSLDGDDGRQQECKDAYFLNRVWFDSIHEMREMHKIPRILDWKKSNSSLILFAAASTRIFHFCGARVQFRSLRSDLTKILLARGEYQSDDVDFEGQNATCCRSSICKSLMGLYRLHENRLISGCCGFDERFETDYMSDASLFTKSFNLEVIEFSLSDERRGYAVRYCQTRILSDLENFNSSDGDGGSRQQECKYAFFLNTVWFDNIIKTPFNNIIYELHEIPILGWKTSNPTFILSDTDATASFSKCRKGYSRFDGKEDARPVMVACKTRPTQFSPSIYQHGFEYEHSRTNIDYVTAKEAVIDSEGPKATCCRSNFSKSLIGLYSLLENRLISVIGISIGSWILLIGRRWLCTTKKKSEKIKLKEKYLKQNGGLLLQQLLNSYDSGVERFQLFNFGELEKATDNFNMKRVLGHGGQGTVYKGMLENGRVIAVKKSKLFDEGKLEEFINEVVILSQINHRNVVKLLGCCLETQVPLLVYEFIPNGTLSEYLHDHNEKFPLTWGARLNIAIEVASALSYLHSGASFSVFHRDIKSTNILLDVNYKAKVADFGTSRPIATDQTHVSTRVVLGTLGYLDPEYYRSYRFTNKSDVYSFGVVLVELLTGQKAIFSTSAEENVCLATYFIHSMKHKSLYEILDAQVKQQGKGDEIIAFANLARRCLNQNGKERPAMKEVVMVLEGIHTSKKKAVRFGKMIKWFNR